MGRAKGEIDEKKLRSRLAKIRAAMPPLPEKRPGGPERLLLEEDYFSLMLFGMLNPVLDTSVTPPGRLFVRVRGDPTLSEFPSMAHAPGNPALATTAKRPDKTVGYQGQKPETILLDRVDGSG